MSDDPKSRSRRSRKNKKNHKKYHNDPPEVIHGNLTKEVVKNDLSVNIFATHSNPIITPKTLNLDLAIEDKVYMSDDVMPPNLTPASSENDNKELSIIEISSEVGEEKDKSKEIIKI